MCVEIFEDGQGRRLQELLDECDCVRFSDGYWYKFTKKTATKERAIIEVCTACKIDAQEIINFGDDYVDIGMLRLFKPIQKPRNITDIPFTRHRPGRFLLC